MELYNWNDLIHTGNRMHVTITTVRCQVSLTMEKAMTPSP